MEKIQVVKTQLKNANGPCVYKKEDMSSVLKEVEALIHGGEPGTKITIEIDLMSKNEYEDMPAFISY